MLAPRLSLFNVFARVYDALTDQDPWRAQILTMLGHVDARRPGLRVLDLGCGPGVSAFALGGLLGSDARVWGVDNAAAMIERARRHQARRYPHLTGVCFLHADACALPFADGAFDLAVGHSFLYLVPDPAGVLREARRLLAPGGALVLMEPRARGSLAAAAWRSRRHARALVAAPLATLRFVASMVAWRVVSQLKGRLSPARVEPLVRAAGFANVAFAPTLGGLGMHVVARVDP